MDKLIKAAKFSENDLKLKLNKKTVHYRPISKYPSITRDLAFLMDKKIKSDDIVDKIYEQSDLINRVELFDEFASSKLGKNKKNLAYHIDLQHSERTLTDKEADSIIKKVVKEIESKFKAKLRDY